MEQLRKSYITLPLPASPAAGAGQATFIATHAMRIVSAQIGLSDTGAGAGATAVQVNRNGVALVTTTALSVAQGAAAKAVKATVSGTPASYPGGQGVQPGDVITVDVLSVPAVTPPKVVTVVLSVTQTDV